MLQCARRYLDLAAGMLWRNTDGQNFALVDSSQWDAAGAAGAMWLGWWHIWGDDDGDGVLDVISSHGFYRGNPHYVSGSNGLFVNYTGIEMADDNLPLMPGLITCPGSMACSMAKMYARARQPARNLPHTHACLLAYVCHTHDDLPHGCMHAQVLCRLPRL